MTYPPQQPDDRRPRGLGEPVSGAPQMQAPATPPPVWRPPVAKADWAPPAAVPLPEPEPTPASRTPWVLIGVMGGAALLGLVASIFLINADPTPQDGIADGTPPGVTCVEPEEPVEPEPLVAAEFYSMNPWESAVDSGESAERLGVWDHESCCDIGLASSQPMLNELGCGYGIEAAYRSADGHMGIGQLILAFRDELAAFEAKSIDFMGYRMAPDSGLYETDMEIYAYSQAIGQYLVVTIGSVDTTDSQIVDRAKNTLGAFHDDYADALVFG